MALNASLTRQLLSAEPWTDQTRRNLVATVLMIVVHEFEALSAAIEEFYSVRFEVDSTLLTDLYSSCPAELQVELVATPAFGRLPPPLFKRYFLTTWENERLTTDQRDTLAYELSGFLHQHPEEAESYRDIVLGLLHSPRKSRCLSGLYLACLLSELAPRDLERIKRKLKAAWFAQRMNALNGLSLLVKRHREVAPEIVQFATSDEIRSLARRIQRADPDKGVRSSAYFLLKSLREYDASSPQRRKRSRR
jgi:hypothetical protein